MILQPGIKAPAFELPCANQEGTATLASLRGQKAVLLFFPAAPDEAMTAQLAKFQARKPDFAAQDAALVGISDAAPTALQGLATEHGLDFVLLSDAQPAAQVARRYGIGYAEGNPVPAVFVLDEDGLVRRVYDASQYPRLPEPAMVLRALAKLADGPRLPSVTTADWHRGLLTAPVVLVEYADYQCGPCQETHRLLKQILPAFGERVCLVHRHFPLRHSHLQAESAAEAAEAAGAQGQFWAMHDRLFEAHGDLGRERLLGYAAEIGLDLSRFTADLDGGIYRAQVDEDFRTAVRHKIKSPPTLFVNGILYEGPRTADALAGLIARLLLCSSSEAA